MESAQKSEVLVTLGEIEYRLSLGCDDRLQLSALVGIFTEIRNISKD